MCLLTNNVIGDKPVMLDAKQVTIIDEELSVRREDG